MTIEKNFSTMINGLDPNTPNAYVFALQVGNANGVAITQGQIDSALAALQDALKATGAEVAATCSIVTLDPFGKDQTARLLINCTQEIADAVSIGE